MNEKYWGWMKIWFRTPENVVCLRGIGFLRGSWVKDESWKYFLSSYMYMYWYWLCCFWRCWCFCWMRDQLREGLKEGTSMLEEKMKAKTSFSWIIFSPLNFENFFLVWKSGSESRVFQVFNSHSNARRRWRDLLLKALYVCTSVLLYACIPVYTWFRGVNERYQSHPLSQPASQPSYFFLLGSLFLLVALFSCSLLLTSCTCISFQSYNVCC